jgi:hypothetical protein
MVLRSSVLLFLLTLRASTALAQQTDPRAPGAIALTELGRLEGTLKQVTAVGERFGRQIYAVGDVDNDGLNDWVLTHRRCDTSFNGYAAIELLLYHGVDGGLPPTSAGVRIGPSEIKSDCSFVGAGDYDGDGHVDIAISTRVLDDPDTRGWWVSSLVVYWGDATGRFSNDDTTHLTAPDERLVILEGPDLELTVMAVEDIDFDRDGVADLAVPTKGKRYIGMVQSAAPYLMIYRGHQDARWGRNSVSSSPDWELWQRMFTRRVSAVDHDGDGALDIAMYVDDNAIGQRGGMSVFYGRRGELPDTTAELVTFASVDGHDGKQGQLIDLTGDHVPELIVSTGDSTNGTNWRWLIYVGRHGQRLLSQYGSGNDAPRPGDSLWWGRPWTEIWTPRHFSTSWNSPFYGIFDPGDIGFDGVGDFCATSYPGIVCYNGGGRLDSWIDATIAVFPADGHEARLARLGDIDGRGRGGIAAPFDGGGVRFYSASTRVPRGGDPIRLPEGSDRPSSAPSTGAPPGERLGVSLSPNPASTYARLAWTPGMSGTAIALLDLHGRELRRWVLPSGVDDFSFNLTGMPVGAFLIRVVSGGRTAIVPLLHLD